MGSLQGIAETCVCPAESEQHHRRTSWTDRSQRPSPLRAVFLPTARPSSPASSTRRLLDQLAGRALRLLAFAVRSDLGDLADYDGSESHRGHRRLADPSQYAAIESDLTFLGLAGLQDPPRPEVRPVAPRLAEPRQLPSLLPCSLKLPAILRW